MASPRARIAAENAEMDARIQALKARIASPRVELKDAGSAPVTPKRARVAEPGRPARPGGAARPPDGAPLADRLMGELAAFRVPLYTDELAKMLDVSKVTVESMLLALVGDGRVRVVSWGLAT